MANYNGVIKIDVSWTSLKTTASSKSIPIQYDASATAYDIFCLDGKIAYATTIFIGAVPNSTSFNQIQNDLDKTDFQNNYKDITTNRVSSPAVALDGYAVTTTNPILIAGSDSTTIRTIKTDTSGRLLFVGLGTAGSPLGGVVSIQGVSGGQAVPISGTVTATNPSISATGSAPPAQATYIGGSVTTAAPTYTTGQMSGLSLTTAGALRIDGSNVTQPVSGTITANAGTGNFTVVQATAGNLNATVTGTVAATQSGTWNITNITGTVSLPTGAATETSLAKLTLVQGSTTSGQSGTLHLGAVTTAAPTYTTAQSSPFSLTTSGSLRVDGSGATQPISGTVTANAGTGTFTVSGTIAATQSGTWIVQPGNTANTTPWLTTISQGGNSATVSAGGALKVDGSAVTQPVSGTITANIGTTNGLALDATLTGNNQRTRITDGTNLATIKAASTAAIASDTAVVVAISPNNTVTVTGTVTAANASVSTTGSAPPGSATYIGGSVTTAAPTYTTGQMSALSLTTAGALRVDNSANTQPISGTITANSVDISPATQNITVLDAGTSNIVGANGQVFYFGTPTTNSAASFTLSSAATVAVQATFIGTGGTMVIEVSMDNGAFWTRVNALQLSSQTYASSFASPFNATVNVSGMTNIRVRSTVSWSGSAAITIRTSQNKRGIGIMDSLPAGSNIIGAVTANIGTTNGLALDTTLTKLTIAQSTALGANTQTLIGGSVTTAAPTYTTGNINPLSLTIAGALRTDSSGTTQPVSGTVISNQGTSNTIANSWGIKITDATNGPVAVKASGVVANSTDNALVVTMSPNTATVAIGAIGFDSFYPDPSSVSSGVAAPISQDVSGNLQTRSVCFTDEGSFRDDLIGSSLTTALTGTITFTNGSNVITGSGTSFTTQVTTNSYIKKTSDSETLYLRIDSIISDTTLTLSSNYAGTTASTTAVSSNWVTITPAGGSITVSNSEVLLLPGTTNGNTVQIFRSGDYLPYTLNIRGRITQRIANQTSTIGFQDVIGTASQQAVIIFDGTSNTSVKFRTSSSSAAADIQDTTVNLTAGLDTSQTLFYEIDLTPDTAILSINGTIVATHTNHLPYPYTVLNICAYVTNAAAVTATTFALDLIYFENIDVLQMHNTFNGDPIKVSVVSNATTSVAGFAFGDTTLAATAQAVVRRTAYTEQTTNFTGSIVSSSANDTAAGTGARSVKITYYDQTGSGPLTEVATLNGTGAVNFVNTNHCFIEKIEVNTVGSGLSNAGTITLKTGAAGAGTTVWTIAVGDNRTFGCHHYIANGKTCNLVDFSVGSTSTTVGQGAVYVLKSISLNTSNVVETQISDFIQLYGQSSTITRLYNTPIQIVGPARVLAYCTPAGASSTTYRASFDFYDQ